jgi:hypothetical protein
MEVTKLPRTSIVLAYGDHSSDVWGLDGITAKLQRRTAAPVTPSIDSDIADNAIVLMWQSVYIEHDWPTHLRRRIILVDLERGYEVKHLEAAQTAGGIGKVRYFEWSADTLGGNHVSGLYARRDVLATMPGPFRLATPPGFASDNYACVYDAPYPDFAAMIVAYATAVLAMPTR